MMTITFIQKNANVFLFGAVPFFIKYVEFIEPKGPVEYKH